MCVKPHPCPHIEVQTKGNATFLTSFDMSLYVSKSVCDDITVDLFIFSKSSFKGRDHPHLLPLQIR